MWFVALYLLDAEQLHAQTERQLLFGVETVAVTGSGDNSSFWHTSNRQGLPSVQSNQGYIHISSLGGLFSPKGFNVDYGVDLGVGYNLELDCFLHQLFVNLNYKWLGLDVGMKERWNDKNHTLSTGALTWSGNSKPIPEIRAGIPDFVCIPLFGKWFSVKGHIGYGRMTDDLWRQSHGKGTYTSEVLFHSKSAFIRLGVEERFPLQVTLGLEMNNMFGGTIHRGVTEKSMPKDASAYWTALFPFHHVGKPSMHHM